MSHAIDAPVLLTDKVQQAVRRGLMELRGDDVVYLLHRRKKYRIADPEEQVRADTLAHLVLDCGYDAACIDTEVRGAHNDYADIVLFEDGRCLSPYLVVENKKRGASAADREEGTDQAFANAIALRAKYALTDFGDESTLYNVSDYPALERAENVMGNRDAIPRNYEQTVTFRLIAGGDDGDIAPFAANELELRIKRAHATIWAGGKRDPLVSFDEWSKMMLAKVYDERYTPNGSPRSYQVGTGESDSSVATRLHGLFADACRVSTGFFPAESRINLPDAKVAQVVRILQDISFTGTDVDVIGMAFESFYGSVFRGQLGQYFTMRPIVRFIIAALQVGIRDDVLDPTCGSGGFLLETLLQVWHRADREYIGRGDLDRLKADFASQHVYGIEIHEVLARICKINLLIHHDGHTNVEADKSCLSPHLSKPKLRTEGGFRFVVGNPPFGTTVEEGDLDQLDGRSLSEYELSSGRRSIQSELAIVEMGVRMLSPGGFLGMVLPDGVFNNSGTQSNCPAFRSWLFRHGRILGVVSLPDYAFRHSGATNKTSILLYQKFEEDEQARIETAMALREEDDLGDALAAAGLDYEILFAESSHIGYNPSGGRDLRNDLYSEGNGVYLDESQMGSLLGVWQRFRSGGRVDDSRCAVIPASAAWSDHPSHRIDPKYHVYKAHAIERVPEGWSMKRLGAVVERRVERPGFASEPDRAFKVLTLSQTGDIRLRPPGIGKNPPEWIGMYFADSPSDWHMVHEGDIVYSGIDVWKGVVCYVSSEYDGALVTSEYPVLRVVDDGVDPRFLFVLLRSRRFRQAFRSINTGHSNRRRTQEADFDNLTVCFPRLEVQREIADREFSARESIREAQRSLARAQSELDALLGEVGEEYLEDSSGISAASGGGEIV